MKRLLRNSVSILPTTVRGGHGWHRPDVPLSFNHVYYHKREISIFDNNLWMYDGSQPEYFLSFNEQHLHDHVGALKDILKRIPWVTLAAVASALYFYFVRNAGFFQAPIPEVIQGGDLYYRKQIFENRKGLRRNFLGMNLTGENGFFYFDYDQPSFNKYRVEREIEKGQKLIRINDEAHSWSQRVQEEARQAVIARKKKESAKSKTEEHH